MAGAGRELIWRLHEQFTADGIHVSISRLCAWFGVARRSVYYRPQRKQPVVKEYYAGPVLVKPRRTLLSENFHTPMDSFHCWLYEAV